MTVDVQFASQIDSAPASIDIVAWVDRAIDAAGHTSAAEISVRVVDATEMQQLNKEFREQDKPTNVLSFPVGVFGGLPQGADVPLGDIVICASVVADEAEQQGKALAHHWAHMIVHGTLHLLGFDHESDNDAAKMENLEVQIMTAHGVLNPYAESPQKN
jgi:probable rRNA maturation factor